MLEAVAYNTLSLCKHAGLMTGFPMPFQSIAEIRRGRVRILFCMFSNDVLSRFFIQDPHSHCTHSKYRQLLVLLLGHLWDSLARLGSCFRSSRHFGFFYVCIFVHCYTIFLSWEKTLQYKMTKYHYKQKIFSCSHWLTSSLFFPPWRVLNMIHPLPFLIRFPLSFSWILLVSHSVPVLVPYLFPT